MKMKLLMIVLLFPMILVAQKNSYFGSVIIPKGDYLVKQINQQKYWSVGKTSTEVILANKNDEGFNVVNFIPAGNGYYFIKFKDNGLYLSNDNKGLYVEKPLRKENQKFKVVDIGGKFKFIPITNLAESVVTNKQTHKPVRATNSYKETLTNAQKLKAITFKNSNTQIFEIINAINMQTWKGE